MSQSLPPEKLREMQAAMREGKFNMRMDMMQVALLYNPQHRYTILV